MVRVLTEKVHDSGPDGVLSNRCPLRPLLRELLRTEHSIYVFTPRLTHPTVIQALVEASLSGLDIQVRLDLRYLFGDDGAAQNVVRRLQKADIPVYTSGNVNERTTINKILVDECVVFTGISAYTGTTSLTEEDLGTLPSGTSLDSITEASLTRIWGCEKSQNKNQCVILRGVNG